MQQLIVTQVGGQEHNDDGVVAWVGGGLGVLRAVEGVKPLKLPVVKRDIFRRRQVAHRWDQAIQYRIGGIPTVLDSPVEKGAEPDEVLLLRPQSKPTAIKGLRPQEHFRVRWDTGVLLVGKKANKIFRGQRVTFKRVGGGPMRLQVVQPCGAGCLQLFDGCGVCRAVHNKPSFISCL